MNRLPFEIIEKIYFYVGNTKLISKIYEWYYNNDFSVYNKKLCLLELKSKTGYYKKYYQDCLSDIKFESALYRSCLSRKRLEINNMFFKFILARNQFIRNIDDIKNFQTNNISVQRERYRKHGILPKKAIIVSDQRI